MVTGWFRRFLIISAGGTGKVERFGRDKTKAGGRFPRNGKEVVWRGAPALEPLHVLTRYFIARER